MSRLGHQRHVCGTREALVEGQYRQGARFAGRLADEVVGEVGGARLERGERSTDDRVVLDLRTVSEEEEAELLDALASVFA